METVWLSLTLLLFLLGVAGTVVPFVPGPFLIFAGALMHRFAVGPAGSAGWWTIAGLGVLMAFAQLFDFLSGTLGAKYFGATRWGMLGGLIGGIVGLFFGLPGLILGPLLGVLLGEMILARQRWKMAAHSTVGAAVGALAGVAIRGVIALVMVFWWALAVWVL